MLRSRGSKLHAKVEWWFWQPPISKWSCYRSSTQPCVRSGASRDWTFCFTVVAGSSTRRGVWRCYCTRPPSLQLIVPFHCESAGTVVALAARQIVAGPLAMFSPIDPLLQSDSTIEGVPPALSCQDVRLFGRMAKEWFGIDDRAAPERALSILCENIFPTTLTSFYRATLELQQIGEELMSLHMGADRSVASGIVSKLLFSYHSHSYALTREEMRGLGLPVASDELVENAAWEIASELMCLLGSGVRASPDADWFDCAVITRERAMFRRVSREERSRIWEQRELR